MGQWLSNRIDVGPQHWERIRSLRVAVIGYGNQGHAQALNLRDSGVDVIVGARADSRSQADAEAAGFDVFDTSEAVVQAAALLLTISDVALPQVFESEIAPRLRPGHTVLLSHGYNARFGTVRFPQEVDVALVSPKGAGALLRSEFLAGRGLAGLVAVHQDASSRAWDTAIGYAAAIGCDRALILKTTFEEETDSDLFSEQTILCGGLPELIKAGFHTLVEAGVQPEIAYFECLYEVKLIADLMVARGLEGMREAVSDTAEWGGYRIGPKIIDDSVKVRMREALAEIRSGKFAQELTHEAESGMVHLESMRLEEAASMLNGVSKAIRELMKKPASEGSEAG